ncbi:MAG: photosynthetic reaction center subunit L, partial [Chloroflexales bacterium]|nr:photosynthetic reaction center subunit L [Chloroflexales bacterium]
MTTLSSASPAGRREDAPGSIVPLALIEEYYKQPGHTFLTWLVGSDPFDFWIGRYFVGLWGVISVLGATLGTIFYLYAGLVKPNTLNILATNIEPPPIQTGLQLPAPGQPGFLWFLIIIFATIAFIGWALRQAEISAKLRMSYEVPIGFFAAISAWLTLQWARPIAMGAWGNGFPLGITAHLDWVSNVGYQYFNFFYNPFHAIAIALFFASTLLLSMHGSAILSAAPSPKRPNVTVDDVDHFWRDILGYSIGEIGIHRLAFWASIGAVLSANLCIFLSGTFVQDWTAFWRFWDRLPIWSLGGTGVSGIAVYVVGMAIARQPESADVGEVYGGIESRLGKPFYVGLIDRVFGSGQFGPIYVGVWGTISIVTGCVCIGIILLDYLRQVGYNPVLFA